jgi:L-alanine-DL-glutamate epimerase-like enolase superfamily enzyme
MKLSFSIDSWSLKEPFVTAKDYTFRIETLTVQIKDGRHVGRGEALGVDYLGETALSMGDQVLAVAPAVDAGIDCRQLQALLPAGGARNAIDCALWDLACKRAGQRIWQLLGLAAAPVTTVYTLSLDKPEAMAGQASAHRSMPALKLKLNGNEPAACLRAVRAARPDAELLIDANGGWSPALLDEMAGVLVDCQVALLEQPLERGADQYLAGLDYPVPLGADESCQGLAELEQAAASYQVINIKLDKCGGLSEALQMVEWCRARGITLMVGNMLGSSLAMAPAMVVARSCRFVDLDGPLWQQSDRAPPLRFNGALVHPPDARLWG